MRVWGNRRKEEEGGGGKEEEGIEWRREGRGGEGVGKRSTSLVIRLVHIEISSDLF